MPVADQPLSPVLALPGVTESLDAARSAVDRLLAHSMMRRRSAEVAAEAALRSARASGALEGCELSLAELRAGSGEPVMQGALRVIGALAELVPTLPKAPLQVLARLHVLAAGDLAPTADLGRPRAGGPGLSARLSGLADLLRLPAGPPALLVAALAEAEMLALQPFEQGNGLVARGLSRLVLLGRGLDPSAVCPVEVGAAADPSRYATALAGYVAGDVAGWVSCYATAATLGAAEGLAICEALVRGEGP